MEPKYIAKRSAWTAVTPLCALLFFLIIPLFIIAFRIIAVKAYSVEFYDDYYVVKSGILSKKENRIAFNGVVAVGIEQTLWGRICNYGTVKVDVVGKHDLRLEAMARPHELKAYLESRLQNLSSTVIA